MGRIHPHVRAVMDEMGKHDPAQAVRAKARAVVDEFVGVFGGEPPFNLEAMASLRGLEISQDPPKHSSDSEIAPVAGKVVLRVNRERPLVRQRFSVGHEIGHTLFPEYQLEVRCRKPSGRTWADPNDQIESLCDVAASELLFPSPWFDEAVANLTLTARSLQELADRYQASSEATIRRFVEVCIPATCVAFCSWKLKPTEVRKQRADVGQTRIFGDEALQPAPKLRVDYAVFNDAFGNSHSDHVPKDKSVPSEGAILNAAQSLKPCDGEMWLDLGTFKGNFHTHVVPIFTSADRAGPDGAASVAVVMRAKECR